MVSVLVFNPSLHCTFNSEPIGSSVPKVADNNIQRREDKIHSQFSLTCEGQGFPSPSFRYFPFAFYLNQSICSTVHASLNPVFELWAMHLNIIFPEPIGSSHPKVTNHDLRRVVTDQGQMFALNCEGQAFPVPMYRFVVKY